MVAQINELLKLNKGVEVSLPVTMPSFVTDTHISGTLSASKVYQEVRYQYYDSGTVANTTGTIAGIIHTNGYLTSVKCKLGTKCTSTDTVVIDVKVGDGTTNTSILTSTISFANADAVTVVKSGVLTGSAPVAVTADQVIIIVVTGTNSTGAKLLVDVHGYGSATP